MPCGWTLEVAALLCTCWAQVRYKAGNCCMCVQPAAGAAIAMASRTHRKALQDSMSVWLALSASQPKQISRAASHTAQSQHLLCHAASSGRTHRKALQDSMSVSLALSASRNAVASGATQVVLCPLWSSAAVSTCEQGNLKALAGTAWSPAVNTSTPAVSASTTGSSVQICSRRAGSCKAAACVQGTADTEPSCCKPRHAGLTGCAQLLQQARSKQIPAAAAGAGLAAARAPCAWRERSCARPSGAAPGCPTGWRLPTHSCPHSGEGPWLREIKRSSEQK